MDGSTGSCNAIEFNKMGEGGVGNSIDISVVSGDSFENIPCKLGRCLFV